MKIVKTKTADGFHFNGLLSEAKNPKGIIIHVHGTAGSLVLNEFYTEMHEQYPQNGISFLVGELRGTGVITDFIHDGEDKTVGNAFEKFEDCIFDIQGWIDYARKLGYQNIWLQGHSFGPSKIAYYLTQTANHGISGAIFLSPADMVGLVHNIDGQKDFEVLYPEAVKLVSEGRGTTLLSHTLWGYAWLSAETFLNLFAGKSNAAIFNFNDDSLGWSVVNEINVSVLSITGTKDDAVESVMEPHAAMQKLEIELKKSPKVKTIVYEGAEHSFNGFGEKIVRDVIDFIG